MNILFICDEYPPGMNGGVGSSIQVLGRELVKQGHNVTVIGLYPYYYGQKDYELDNGVEVYRLRYDLNFGHKKHFINKVISKLPDFIKQKINRKKAFVRFTDIIYEMICQKAIDIIEIADWNTFSYDMGFKVVWPLFPSPLIVKLHGSYSYLVDQLNYAPNKNNHEIDKMLLEKRADAISSVSYYTAKVNKSLFNIQNSIEILYNGIELTEGDFHVNKTSNLVIFTGALVVGKGVFSLMKAWNLVIKEIPEARLVMYGKGDKELLVNLLGEKSRASVLFFGHVPREHLFNQLRKANLAVFPSYAECFSLAPIESMSVGCPTIFTKRTSGPELIQDGFNGALVEPDNYEEIARKIIEILRSKEIQSKYSDNGIKTIKEHFSIEKLAKDHIVFYEKVVLNHKK